jgi:Protein of unknown function (DUF3987)
MGAGYAYRPADITRALNGAKRALLAAETANGRMLAIRDGNADLKRLCDDDFGAVDELSNLAISLGVHPDDVQKALACGVEIALEERGREVSAVSAGFRQNESTSNNSRAYEVSAVSAVSAEGGSDWGDPDWGDPDWGILNGRQGNLPDFPGDVFPPPVRAWLERASHGAGATTAHVAIPFLGAVSSLIGTARCVHPVKAWPEPCTTWMGIVGFSGTGKTPGLDVVKRALDQIEKNRKHRLAKLQLDHETRAEAAKAALKKWKADVEEAIEHGKGAPDKPASATDPGPFVIPKLHVSNTTIERLATLLTVKPRGQLVITDELSGLFLNMSRYTNGQDNEFWLEAWNGKSFNVERQTRSISVDYLLVGLLGGFQPDKLGPSFGDRHDGMYARLCFGWPAEADYRPLNDNADAVDDVLYNILTKIIDLPSEEEGVFAPRKVGLSAAAVQEFEKYRKFMHETRKGLEGREREWFCKTPAHILRLAGTLTFIRWAALVGAPEPTEVDVVSLRAAIGLVKGYFWPHSRAVMQRIGGNERGANARLVVRWAFAKKKTEVSVLDVRRTVFGGRVNAKQAEEILDDLVVCGFLQRVTSETGKKGGRPTVRWLINPKATLPSETAETAETCQPIEIIEEDVPCQKLTETAETLRECEYDDLSI